MNYLQSYDFGKISPSILERVLLMLRCSTPANLEFLLYSTLQNTFGNISHSQPKKTTGRIIILDVFMCMKFYKPEHFETRFATA